MAIKIPVNNAGKKPIPQVRDIISGRWLRSSSIEVPLGKNRSSGSGINGPRTSKYGGEIYSSGVFLRLHPRQIRYQPSHDKTGQQAGNRHYPKNLFTQDKVHKIFIGEKQHT